VADFTGMGPGNIYISKALHRAFWEFDEKGGRAGSATAIETGLESVSMAPVLRFDQPFIALLMTEAPTNTLLFAGVVNDPSGE
jgi:serine protease inhibitor